jgi:type VI secretion system protein ImpC
VQAWAANGGAKVSRSNRKRKARDSAPAADARLDDFARLVGRTGDAETPAESTVDALLRRVVAPFVVPAANPQKDALVASVDAALSDAMRTVLHHPDFQSLESLWRGTDFLLRRLETGPGLQVHLIDLSAEEFAADLSSADDLGESGLYQLLVDTPSQDKNGGYTLLCGLYQFESTPPHTELLGRMAQIAQHAGAPFLTSIAIDDLCNRKKPPHALVQQALKALQELPAASHLGLLGPRFMLRHPYGKRTDPISSFEFEEFSASEGLGGMLWGHPALLAACAIAGPGGTTIGELPFHHYKDAAGDTLALPCTERLINVDTATALRALGISALMAHKGAPELRIAGLDAVNGAALGKVSVAPAKPRVGVETKVTVANRVSVSATAKKPPRASGVDELEEGEGTLDDFGSDFDAETETDTDTDFDFGSDDSADDLDALLAGLGGDDDASDDGDAADDEMDPDLAALLASLD